VDIGGVLGGPNLVFIPHPFLNRMLFVYKTKISCLYKYITICENCLIEQFVFLDRIVAKTESKKVA